MAGLVGIAGARGAEETARRFDAARDRLLRHAGMSAEHLPVLGGACVLGRVPAGGPGPRRPAPRPSPAFFHGVLHNRGASAAAEVEQRPGFHERIGGGALKSRPRIVASRGSSASHSWI